MSPETHGAVLVVPDEGTLVAQAERLRVRGLVVTEIREDSPPWNGQLMALAIAPGPKKTLKPHFGGLPCLREVPMKK